MKTNIGAFDGWFRILLFITSLCAAIIIGGNTWYFVIPTTFLFITTVLIWCPVYEMLGINTDKEKAPRKK